MVLTVIIAVGVGLAALLGLLRELRAGLVAVAGTLMAAVLVDLWAEPLADWVRSSLRPELPATPTFVLVAGVFLLTTGVLGYGGAALLPRAGADEPGLLGRLLGALLGALNGAMVAGYLLRYAVEAWDDGQTGAIVAGSPAASLLVAWLPWYVLGIAAVMAGVVCARLVGALVARRTIGAGSVARAPTLTEADRRLSDKIDQALRK